MSYPPSGQPPYNAPPPPAGGYGGAGYGPPPPNNLIFAILATVFCCLPLGVVSIVYAAQVNSKWAMGDAVGANESARKARQFAMYSVILGVIVGVVYFGLTAAGVFGGLWSVSTTGY